MAHHHTGVILYPRLGVLREGLEGERPHCMGSMAWTLVWRVWRTKSAKSVAEIQHWRKLFILQRQLFCNSTILCFYSPTGISRYFDKAGTNSKFTKPRIITLSFSSDKSPSSIWEIFDNCNNSLLSNFFSQILGIGKNYHVKQYLFFMCFSYYCVFPFLFIRTNRLCTCDGEYKFFCTTLATTTSLCEGIVTHLAFTNYAPDSSASPGWRDACPCSCL